MSAMMIEAKTVEQWLNEVVYANDDKYVPSKFAMEFINFIKLVNGEDGEENKTPVLHYRMLDQIGNIAPNQHSIRIANMIHRGAAKTTIMGEYLFLYIATFGKIPGFGAIELAIYVSDSMENGVKNMRKNLEYRYENSDFLRKYVPQAKFTDVRWEFTNVDGNVFVVKGYGAKALSLDTNLHTETGLITIGDCKVGDRIFGADGKLCTITQKSEIFHKPMYQLELEDGRKLKVSEDHYNPVCINIKPNGIATWEDRVLTTLELLQQPLKHFKTNSSKHLVQVPNIKPIQFEAKVLPIDPYTLGVVLGDARIRKECGSVELTCHSDELPHYHSEIPYTFGAIYKDPRSNAVTQSIRGLGKMLKALGLNVRGEFKFIPHEYFYGSIDQRLSLLQGLMDTDGTVSPSGRTTFCSSSYQLCDDVAALVRSLGGTAFIHKCSGVNAWKVEVWMVLPIFRLQRKLARFKPRERKVNLIAITPIAQEPSQCIAVDNEDRQFIADSYFRTHNTGVRGTKEMGTRPKLAVLDDLVSDEDARSKTIIDSIKDTVSKAVEYALHPTKSMVLWQGTPFNANDPLYVAVESGAWQVNVFPVCERFPCTRDEFKGSWPDRFTFDYVERQYTKAMLEGKVEAFYQEMMLRIMSDDDRLILEGDIRWYSFNSFWKNRHNFNFYITTDFAVSEKQHADFSSINVWAVNHLGQWFWVDGVLEKLSMDKNIDILFKFAQKYMPKEVGIEVSGQQGGFIPWINDEMIRRNIFFSMASSNNSNKSGIRPVTDKLARFNTVVPWFKQGKMFFPSEKRESPILKEAIGQLLLVCAGGIKSKKDDFIDGTSQLSQLKVYLPSPHVDLVKGDSEGVGVWGVLEDPMPNSGLDSYIV